MKSKSKILTSLSLVTFLLLTLNIIFPFNAFASEESPNCSLGFYARSTTAIRVVVTSDECTGYEIEYSKNKNMTGSSVITAKYGVNNVRISGLASGTNYYIRARSYTTVYTENDEDTDTTGTEYVYGEYSNILADATLPGTPSISYAKNSVSAIRFDINGTVGGSGYEAKYSKNSDMSSSKTASVEKVGSSQGRISGLKSGTVYYIQLRAYVNINGNKVYGSWSSKMKGITKSDPTTITFTKYSAEAVRVKISKVACSGYQVRYSKNSDMSSSKTVKAASTDKEVRISGLKSGTKYYVQIRTYAKLSSTTYYSSWSKKIPVTAKPVKSTISSTSSPSSSSIKVKVKSQTCTGYQIQYSSKKDFSTSKSKFSSSGKSSLTIGSLKAGTTYYVRVRAYRTCNGVKYYGPWSAVKSQTIFDNGIVQQSNKYYYLNSKGKKVTGWAKVGNNYYYFDRTTGAMKMGGTEDGIKLSSSGQAKASSNDITKIKTMMKAREIYLSITNTSDSKSAKLKKCFNWVLKHPYKRYRTLAVGKKSATWMCTFANDEFNKGNGCCVSEACAFTFLANECGYNAYVCDNQGLTSIDHAWTEIDGKVYDTLFAEAKSYSKYYGTSYATTGFHKVNMNGI